ncbi:uncharacterized protein PAC_15387 [Phialocephala subalpina]|uniref:Uncharacterized protein n=1 Tax=Phialocephala subalpina TaxID=576137 RepID=A0A1L7XKM2_9HELO|nr:uncharacterized protein PAC_15387 [Phialocephala subalpina]
MPVLNFISPAGLPTATRYPWQHQLTRTSLDLSDAWTRGMLSGIIIAVVAISFLSLAAIAVCVRWREVKKTSTTDVEKSNISDLKKESGLGVGVVENNLGEECLVDGKGLNMESL